MHFMYLGSPVLYLASHSTDAERCSLFFFSFSALHVTRLISLSEAALDMLGSKLVAVSPFHCQMQSACTLSLSGLDTCLNQELVRPYASKRPCMQNNKAWFWFLVWAAASVTRLLS